MSVEYWDRRLNNVYVKHEGEFKYVEMLDVDPEHRDHRLPEDSLPHIRFLTTCGLALKRDEFECVFPRDQFVRQGDTLTWGSRVLQKAWRQAPSRESYELEGTMKMQDWLNGTLKPFEPDDPEKIWDPAWTTPVLLTRTVAFKPSTVKTGTLWYGPHKLASLSRTKTYQYFKLDRGPIPDRLIPGLVGKMDGRQPIKWENYPVDDERLNPGELDLRQMHFMWEQADRFNELIRDWRVYVERDDATGFPICLHFRVTGNIHTVHTENEIPRITRSLTADVKKMLTQLELI